MTRVCMYRNGSCTVVQEISRGIYIRIKQKLNHHVSLFSWQWYLFYFRHFKNKQNMSVHIDLWLMNILIKNCKDVKRPCYLYSMRMLFKINGNIWEVSELHELCRMWMFMYKLINSLWKRIYFENMRNDLATCTVLGSDTHLNVNLQLRFCKTSRQFQYGIMRYSGSLP